MGINRIKYILALTLLLTGCATARPWTTKEKTMLAVSCLAMTADIYTTIDGIHDGNYETNPMIGRHPSDGKIIATMITTQLVTVVLAHYWEDFRIWILGIKTGVNAGFVFHNTRTD